MPQELNGRFECTQGTSNKFYEIRYQRNSDTYLCTFGPIGSSGQESLQEYDFVLKKHRAFAGKGYRLVSGSSAVSNEAPRITTPARPVKEEPAYTKSRLESIDDEDEPVKPKEKKKDEEPRSRLSKVE